MSLSHKTKLAILVGIGILLVVVFMTIDVGGHWDYILPRRGKKLLAILLTGTAVAFSTVVFQTITNNRILTPSIIGLDSLYMLLQTFIVFLFGGTALTLMSKNLRFLLAVGFMVLFAGLLYRLLFRKEGRNIYHLLLIGLVFGTFFSSLSSFLQKLIDPNEFLVIQDKMFASFNNVDTDLLMISLAGVLLVGWYFARFSKYLDVLALGRDHAVNLGISYEFVVKRMLIVVAVLISISTALVGPITFLGLLVANVAYQFLDTYRHQTLILGASLISFIALLGGQLLVERVFTFSTSLSVIINFIGGVYFIYLMLKENKS
ncbi:putative ABC transporter permease protein YclO [Paenibacillus macerans]|uniref:ABC 3 transport family protein n=1 Tax=Paenibacillus macerans TaxID=44252 RepID=A0A090Y681_PAEMA|nr:iron chelate uptake ABC transporter family permease subunit [Paenibacillus macerans]KFM94258.1 ABC 3 transport family protein [Paenibacillus macerans]MCY7558607.1 iron chelate uptake ABC transporter family permease subunit [Paenibacillus macerans]MDU7473168.1 iron chelate uptake ABC transporter family permease subunit [Paenibacillus macerans]MEC0150809.1 iron chelate uptake ABC transporter family permease subunit [Paenibacillus macerans]MED4956534.1 iron chelate uptake ABC transporter famil